MTLRVTPAGWAFPSFEPGQYVSLGLFGAAPRSELAEPERIAPPAEKLLQRPYSIASPPEGRASLEFYINLVPAGVLTPRLFRLASGDPVWLGSKIAGSFTVKSAPERANLVLVATGTGLAPYISMLTSGAGLSGGRRIALLHGVRQSQDLGYRPLLTALHDAQPQFTYLPVVSRPHLETQAWEGLLGHVQDVWNSGALERAWGFRPDPEHTHVLLCGSPAMIESMIAILARDGFRLQTPRQPGEVHAEQYWPIRAERRT
jgi:ferredoxin--NADP+ reductase